MLQQGEEGAGRHHHSHSARLGYEQAKAQKLWQNKKKKRGKKKNTGQWTLFVSGCFVLYIAQQSHSTTVPLAQSTIVDCWWEGEGRELLWRAWLTTANADAVTKKRGRRRRRGCGVGYCWTVYVPGGSDEMRRSGVHMNLLLVDSHGWSLTNSSGCCCLLLLFSKLVELLLLLLFLLVADGAVGDCNWRVTAASSCDPPVPFGGRKFMLYKAPRGLYKILDAHCFLLFSSSSSSSSSLCCCCMKRKKQTNSDN